MIGFTKRSFGVKAGLPVRILRNAETCGFAVRRLFPARRADGIRCAEKVWPEGRA